MARSFNGSTQYLSVGSALVTASPWTFACWFYANDVTTGNQLFSIGDTGTDNDYWRLAAQGNDPSADPVRFSGRSGGTLLASIDTTTSYSANTWHHACGISHSASSASVYLDGGGKTTANPTGSTPANLDSTAIGVLIRNSPTGYMNGRQAECGLWNVALTDAEVAILANGFSPLLVRPESLVAYWPLVRGNLDLVGGNTLSETGSPGVSNHPRVIYPRRRNRIFVPTAAGSSVSGNLLQSKLIKSTLLKGLIK